jgi:hypothetical protein
VFIMKATSRVALAAAVLGFLAAAGQAKAGLTVTFDSPGDVGTWTPDRYAPSGFASGTSGGGRTGVLTESISATDFTRPVPYNGAFYNTQGKGTALPAGTNSMSVELYVDPTWASLNQTVAGVNTGRLASFWGFAYGPGGSSPADYPFIEFNNNIDGTGGFRIWDDALDNGNGAYENVAGFAGYGQWYTLGIEVFGGNIAFSINGVLAYTVSNVGPLTLGNAVLQGYNAGNDYKIYWDNLSADPVPEPATLISVGIASVLCAGFAWTRRRAARVTA